MQLPPEDIFYSDLFQSTSARYLLEHRELPQAFYNLVEPELRKSFIDSLVNNRSELLRIMYALICQTMEPTLKEKQVDYPQDSFDVQFFDSEESGAPFDCNLVVITMPKPERTPLCRRIYMLYSDDLERQGFFTVEKTDPLVPGDGDYFLCGWNAYGSHFNCGTGYRQDDFSNRTFDPTFLVAPNLTHDAPVNLMPDQVKWELRSIYDYFSGRAQPELGFNPERLKELIEEWKDAHPDQDPTEEEIANLMKRSLRYEE